MKVTQWKKEIVRDSWDEKEDKRKFQEQERTKNRSEMRTPPETVRCTLFNASTLSTEK